MESSIPVKLSGDHAVITNYVWDASADGYIWKEMERDVAMVIEAPRGRVVIFKPWGSYDRCGEAVKAFMEQHRNG